MQVDDRARPGLGHDAASHGASVGGGPVRGGDIPHHHPHVVGGHHPAQERRPLPVRRPVEGGADAEAASEGVISAVELGVAGVEPAPLVVVVRVVGEELAVAVQRPHLAGAGIDGLAHEEERALGVVLVEDASEGQ